MTQIVLPRSANQFRDDLLKWGADNRRDYPWRDPDASLYEVFIAEFFLTQTPADNVAAVYPSFVDRFPSLSSISEIDIETLETHIEPLGFQNMRATALSEIAAQDESLPDDPDSLQELPRVGPYVANATICFALDERIAILDRNVCRVYQRVFGESFPEVKIEQEAFAEEMLPETGRAARRYNLSLLDFGALVCTKLDPACESCIVRGYCEYYQFISDK